jgi:hypothetical protein
MDDACVLPRREVRLLRETARKQISSLAAVGGSRPLADSTAGLLGDLDCAGRPVFFRIIVARSRTRPPASTSSILRRTRSPPLTLLLMAKLNIARSRLRHSQLKPDANGPDILRPQRTLLDDQAALVPRSRCREEVGVSVASPSPLPSISAPTDQAGYSKRRCLRPSSRWLALERGERDLPRR